MQLQETPFEVLYNINVLKYLHTQRMVHALRNKDTALEKVAYDKDIAVLKSAEQRRVMESVAVSSAVAASVAAVSNGRTL